MGRFAVNAVEPTCREYVHARIRWDNLWMGPRTSCSTGRESFSPWALNGCSTITEDMQSFGLRLEDGTIIATDEAYVPLLMSGYYYAIRPTFSNQF